MSFTISKSGIQLTRGDTFSMPVFFHQPIRGATITIEVYQKSSIQPLIKKDISVHADEDHGKSVLLLEKELTNIPIGEYIIKMYITFLDGKRYTFFPARPDMTATLSILDDKKD